MTEKEREALRFAMAGACTATALFMSINAAGSTMGGMWPRLATSLLNALFAMHLFTESWTDE